MFFKKCCCTENNKLKKEIEKLKEDRDQYKSWYLQDKEQLALLQKEKEENWKDIKIQVYEDVLKIEKRFLFVPRS